MTLTIKTILVFAHSVGLTVHFVMKTDEDVKFRIIYNDPRLKPEQIKLVLISSP